METLPPISKPSSLDGRWMVPECVARVPVSLWGSGGWGCVHSTLRSRSQPFATVRNSSQPSALSPYGRAYGKFCRGGPFWRFQTCRCFVSRGRCGTSWHSDVFCNASKVVLRGRRNTFATFSEDVLQFSWHFTLYTSHSTLYKLHTPHSTLYTPHFTLHTPHSTLYTPHFTLHTPHFARYTPHSTLYTLHSTLHTLHFALHTPHSTHYTPHSTLYTLYIPHCTLYTPRSTLYTFHSTLQTGNKGNMYKTVQINYCRKVLCVTAYPCVLTSVPLTYVWAFGFVGFILFFSWMVHGLFFCTVYRWRSCKSHDGDKKLSWWSGDCVAGNTTEMVQMVSDNAQIIYAKNYWITQLL